MSRIMTTVITSLLFTGMSLAQNTSASDQETIRLLVQQVKELQEKVKALEAKQSDSEATPPQPTTVQQGVAEQAAEPHQSPIAPPALHELSGIQWRGFGEVNYKVLDQRQPELSTFGFVPGSAGNFYTGEFALFLTSRINDKASVLSEIVFDEHVEQKFDVDMERLLFKYDLNDYLRMSFGRYQTGISYFNTQYHSGRWFLTTADRPLITEFASEGGLLPTQAVGVSLTGLVPSGRLGLNYILEYGSSDTNRPHIDGTQVEDDEDNGNHVNLGLFARPDAIPGLQFGGSFYHDKVTNHDFTPATRLGQSIVNAHVVYVGHGIEFLNEGFLIRHAQEHSQTVFNMPAFYSQFSKRFRRFVHFSGISTRIRIRAASLKTYFCDMARPLARAMTSMTTSRSRHNWITRSAKTSQTLMVCNCSWRSLSEAMTNMNWKWVAALILSWTFLSLDHSALAQTGDVAVVVNPENPASNLTMPELRKLFAGEKRSWAGGLSVKLIVRGPGAHEREVLLKLLGVSESEYKRYWASRVMRGEAQAEPLVLPSLGMQREAMGLFDGGITLVVAENVKPGMKVVKVNGRMPGDAGYPLH